MTTTLFRRSCALTLSFFILVAGCNTEMPNGDGGDGGAGGGGNGGTVSLSGSITVTATGIVDGDTNDPTNAVIANNGNDLTEVQDAPNPGTVGGFLGTIGNSQDAFDIYRVQLAAGQSVSLLLANPTANDFDLFLFDEAGNVLVSSEGVGRAEQVVAPTNGTFLVQVFGFSVAMNGDTGGLYTMLVGGAAASATVAPSEMLSSLFPHVPGEVIVRYNKNAARNKGIASTDDFDFEAINSTGSLAGFQLVRTKRRAVAGNDGNRSKSRTASFAAPILNRPSSDVIASIKQLRRRGDVATAEPNYMRFAQAVPNDEFFNFQWHYPLIGLPDAWDITTGDPSVIVAVIDSGVVLAHPDLAGQLIAGIDMISDPTISLDGDGIDTNPNDPGDLNIQGTKSTFHGTHVSGTIGAATNNGLGVAGVAWGIKIMPIRVLGKGGGTDFDIVQGILFAAGLPNDSGTVPPQPADVINMSLGGQGFSSAEQAAIDAARNAGVIVVAAAGNDSTNADTFSPAGLTGVVTVSAVGFTRDLAPYSNFGSSVDVAAPGGDLSVDANGDTFPDGVLSSLAQDDGSFVFDFSQGTSMASPHIAGVVALMKSVNANMTPLDFDQLLAGTHPGTTIRITDDLGATGKDTAFGHGLINALGAVRAAAAIAGIDAGVGPVMRIVPRNLDFGAATNSASVVVNNAGGETLTVTGVTTDETWLSVTPQSGGEGSYQISVNRGSLDDGVFTGTVTFNSNGGSVSVSVRMGVGAQGATGGDIGTIFVLVLDLENGTSVGQFNATAANGYAFSFEGIPAGQYGVFAGTDMDNDSFIDNEGEALGGFPTVVDAAPIDLTENRTGLVFNVAYQINVQTPSAASASLDRSSVTSDRMRLRRIR